MTKQFIEFIYNISTGKTSLTGLDPILSESIELMLNDKNSSLLREAITLHCAGVEHHDGKLKEDGFKIVDDKRIPYEVKPQSADHLNGGGSFSDYTPARYFKALNQNGMMLCSGFVNGKLLYVIEFPYKLLKHRIEEQLKKTYGEDLTAPIPQKKYVRSLQFNFTHYSYSQDVILKYLNPDYIKYKTTLSTKFISYLDGFNNNKINEFIV